MMTQTITAPPPIAHNKDFSVTHGHIEVIAPYVRRVVAPNASPFTFTGTGTYLVGDQCRTVVIDPGPDLPSHIDILIETLKETSEVLYAITHTHRDHSPATGALKEALGGISYAYGPHGGGSRTAVTEEAADWDFVPDVTLADGDRIEGEDWTLMAVHTPGHTSNHMCFYLPEQKALFSGDHVMGWATSVVIPPNGDMAQYKNSLRRVLDLDLEVVWPTHGAPILEPLPYIQSLLNHRIHRENQILAVLETAPHLLEDMVKEIYADIPSYMHPAAAQSLYAHLLHMIEVGTVKVKGPPSHESLFRRG